MTKSPEKTPKVLSLKEIKQDTEIRDLPFWFPNAPYNSTLKRCGISTVSDLLNCDISLEKIQINGYKTKWAQFYTIIKLAEVLKSLLSDNIFLAADYCFDDLIDVDETLENFSSKSIRLKNGQKIPIANFTGVEQIQTKCDEYSEDSINIYNYFNENKSNPITVYDFLTWYIENGMIRHLAAYFEAHIISYQKQKSANLHQLLEEAKYLARENADCKTLIESFRKAVEAYDKAKQVNPEGKSFK